jgi:hypothetical protein
MQGWTRRWPGRSAWSGNAPSRSLSQVVKESLTRYCDEELSEGGEPLSILKSAGFVGCADGPADLSSGYKKDLTRSLGRKA